MVTVWVRTTAHLLARRHDPSEWPCFAVSDCTFTAPIVYLVQHLVVVVWVCVLCGRWYAIMRCGVHPEVTVAEEQNGG